jgi:mortality factor 4-like protein 1
MSNVSSSSSSSSVTSKSASETKSTKNPPKFREGEKIFCFHGTLIYEAKCIKIEKKASDLAYLVHYNGWSKNWDEWVPISRILKYNKESIQKQKELIDQKKMLSGVNKRAAKCPLTKNGEFPQSENSNITSSSPSSSSSSSSSCESNTKKRKLNEMTSSNIYSNQINDDLNSIENSSKTLCKIDITFKHNRFVGIEKLTIVIPECLKEWLIDDFDMVIHQNKIIKLPSKKAISTILNDYHNQTLDNKEKQLLERGKRCLDEIIKDLIDYFNSMLGSQLLYKFERIQYTEILKLNKKMSDIYGPMHLLRLFERLKQMLEYAPLDEGEPLEDLIYYTNDILRYLEKLEKHFFSENDYILAPPFYVRSSI